MAMSSAFRAWLQERGALLVGEGPQERVVCVGEPAHEDQEGVDGVREQGLGWVAREPRETLVLGGEDAIPWLQGLVTSDLMHLAEEGRGQRTTWVNHTGRFVGEGRLLHFPEALIMDLEAGTLEGGLLGHLKRHIILEKVTLEDRSAQTTVLGLYGRGASMVLEQAGSWAHRLSPGSRPMFAGTWGQVAGQGVVVQRVPWCVDEAYELRIDREQVLAVIAAIEDAVGRPLPLCGEAGFERMRLEAGVPRFGVELHAKVIPLEAGFEDAIAYDKGCYLGQEIIARLDTRGTPAKMLRRVRLRGSEAPAVGALVEARLDGAWTKKGEVVSVARAIRGPGYRALVSMKRGAYDVGQEVRLGDESAELEALSSLPGA
ncbi:hypothetical protein DL240_13590 [Lujinxingia litoralis]|uniref:GCVT N-terminal domain-containing protein n=1 Tax=Lujinxingia litoralis TaxID=2211119 RepID=A0A328C329_9DELT|nr:hypothetical protein [Lujinxingia litoralis]RAL21161.1 hypothetical protein DL240_13590 [Lujinxingia litoralis]